MHRCVLTTLIVAVQAGCVSMTKQPQTTAVQPSPEIHAGVTLDQLLAAAPVERTQLIAELTDEGPAGLRRLRAEVERRPDNREESKQIAEILTGVRARLASVSPMLIRKLDSIGDYHDPQLWDENELLCDLLDGSRGSGDCLRAETLRAFFRRYVNLVGLPAEQRAEWDRMTCPQEVLRRLLRHPLGPETVEVLDEHLPILLYHHRVRHVLGVQKLTAEYMNSPLLARGTYELLLDLLIQGVHGQRPQGERWMPGGARSLHPDGDATLERAETQAWPALGVAYLPVLWQARLARPEDRERLWSAGLDAMLNATGSEDTRRSLFRQLRAMLLGDLVPEEWVRALLERASDARDEWDSTRISVASTLLTPYLRQIPRSQKHGHSGTLRWQDVLNWWDAGGRTAPPARPLDAPLKAFACIILAPNGNAERLQILWTQTDVAPDRVSRAQRQTEYGVIDFCVGAKQLTWDESALFVTWGCDLWTADDIDAELENLPNNLRLGKQLWNGLSIDFCPGIAYVADARNHDGVMVMLIDKPEALSIPTEPDLDWIFAEFYRRCPPGARVCIIDLSSTGAARILPKKYQVMVVDRYYDELGPAGRRNATALLNRSRRMIPFATRSGGVMGLRYLRDWVDQKWTGWEKAEPLLLECETLARVSGAPEGERADFIEALRDPVLRAATLCELARPERLEQMTETQRVQKARAIALDILPTETDPAECARLDQILRVLSGEDFGYNPFASPTERKRALQAWISWAEQPLEPPGPRTDDTDMAKPSRR